MDSLSQKHQDPGQTDAHPAAASLREFGGGLLPVITVAGVVLAMTQGAVYYKAKTSTQFLTNERNRVMAQQAAEAGVENAVASLGSRRVVVQPGMNEYALASDHEVGSGVFSTSLSTVALGPNGDTVDLTSVGQVNDKSKTVVARLKLRNLIDTNQVILAEAKPDTSMTITTQLVYDTTYTTTIQDPEAMPALNTTAAYAACMSSSAKKCDICHLPSGDVSKANVINVSKSAIGTHISHHGDYVTTDGTCDIYKPKTTASVTSKLVPDTLYTITTSITYDTVMTIDTSVKVQILSWK